MTHVLLLSDIKLLHVERALHVHLLTEVRPGLHLDHCNPRSGDDIEELGVDILSSMSDSLLTCC